MDYTIKKGLGILVSLYIPLTRIKLSIFIILNLFFILICLMN
jgi:hypothetical protein